LFAGESDSACFSSKPTAPMKQSRLERSVPLRQRRLSVVATSGAVRPAAADDPGGRRNGVGLRSVKADAATPAAAIVKGCAGQASGRQVVRPQPAYGRASIVATPACSLMIARSQARIAGGGGGAASPRPVWAAGSGSASPGAPRPTAGRYVGASSSPVMASPAEEWDDQRPRSPLRLVQAQPGAPRSPLPDRLSSSSVTTPSAATGRHQPPELASRWGRT